MFGKKVHFFRMDTMRCLLSGRILLGTFGVTMAMLFASANLEGSQSVLEILILVAMSVPFLIVLPFCALPYAGCFCEDLEYNYANIEIIRGNLKRYAASKIMIIILSSIATMVTGFCLFVLLIRFRIPWRGAVDSAYDTLEKSSNLVKQEHFILYILMISVQFSLIAAALSLLGAFVSLYISNKLLVLSVPLMAYYFIMYYSSMFFSESPYADIRFIFTPTSYSIWRDDLLSFLWAFWIAGALILILSIAIYKKLKGRLACE